MEQLDDIIYPTPLDSWSSTPFVILHCVCGSKLRAYTTYATRHDDFNPQRLTKSLQRHRPVAYPCTWYLYRGVAAVVDIDDLQAFRQIHPRDHSYQCVPRQSRGLERLTISDVYSNFLIDRYHEEKKEEESEICAVCHAEFEKNERTITLFCKHRFHVHCITEWLHRKNECPLCRRFAL
ncbi:hypothetical protein OSB04_004970 [Centaurea solstitialis]|uniref:RING-type E3 ubiquitin transferase n=1 Tax=Centaurea solstitialis TaxID=347529 RepID=A0AA38TRR2_9ASTR|nr:hypothetical protein OSB04_004970 [Centaurea solstitialis]